MEKVDGKKEREEKKREALILGIITSVWLCMIQEAEKVLHGKLDLLLLFQKKSYIYSVHIFIVLNQNSRSY